VASSIKRPLHAGVITGKRLAEPFWLVGPYAGAFELLTKLREQHLLACLSNTNELDCKRLRAGLRLHFANSSKLPVEGYPHILVWHERLRRMAAWEDPFGGLA
jgi:hypothetical protein